MVWGSYPETLQIFSISFSYVTCTHLWQDSLCPRPNTGLFYMHALCSGSSQSIFNLLLNIRCILLFQWLKCVKTRCNHKLFAVVIFLVYLQTSRPSRGGRSFLQKGCTTKTPGLIAFNIYLFFYYVNQLLFYFVFTDLLLRQGVEREWSIALQK